MDSYSLLDFSRWFSKQRSNCNLTHKSNEPIQRPSKLILTACEDPSQVPRNLLDRSALSAMFSDFLGVYPVICALPNSKPAVELVGVRSQSTSCRLENSWNDMTASRNGLLLYGHPRRSFCGYPAKNNDSVFNSFSASLKQVDELPLHSWRASAVFGAQA